LFPARRRFAWLDADTKNYEISDGACGSFLVSVRDVRPWSDGQQLTLRVGTPLVAQFIGLKLKVRWGPRYSVSLDDSEALEAWTKSLRSADYNLGDTINPAQWHDIQVVLPRTSTKEVGHVLVEISPVVVRLSPSDNSND
jgi:hypothetical protein